VPASHVATSAAVTESSSVHIVGETEYLIRFTVERKDDPRGTTGLLLGTFRSLSRISLRKGHR
jgi:hypothetical protein